MCGPRWEAGLDGELSLRGFCLCPAQGKSHSPGIGTRAGPFQRGCFTYVGGVSQKGFGRSLPPIKITYVRRDRTESSADDLRTSRGVVLDRAASTLRSIETQPLTGEFVGAKTDSFP